MDLAWLALGVVVPSALFGYLAGARLTGVGLLRQREQTAATFNRTSSWAVIGTLRLILLVVSLSRLKPFAYSGSTVGQLLGLTGCAAEAVVHGAAILCLAHGFRGTYAAFTWRATLAQIACIAVQSAGHLAEVLAITHAPGHSGSTAAGAAPQAAFSLVFPYLLHGLVLSVQQDWPRRFTYQLAAVSVYWPLHAAVAALTATSGMPSGLATACEPSGQCCLSPGDAGVSDADYQQRQQQHALTDNSPLYFFTFFHLFMVGQACYVAFFDPDRQLEGTCSSKGQPLLRRRRSRRQLYSQHGEQRPTFWKVEGAQMASGPTVSADTQAAAATAAAQTPDSGGLPIRGRDWATPPQERHPLHSRPEALQLNAAGVAQHREGPHVHGEHGPACTAMPPALYPTCLSPQHALRDGGLQESSSPLTANDAGVPPRTLLHGHGRVSQVLPAARPDSSSAAHLPSSTTPAPSQPRPAPSSKQGRLSRALSLPRASLSAWVLPPSDIQQHDLWQLRQGLSSLMACGVLAAQAAAAVTASGAAGLSAWRLLPSLLLTAALILANASVGGGLLLQQLGPGHAWARALCGLCAGPRLAVVLRVQQLLRSVRPCGLVLLLPPQLRGLFAFRAYAIAAVQSLSTPQQSLTSSLVYHMALALLARTTQLLTDPSILAIAGAGAASATSAQAWAWRLLQQHLDLQHVLPEYLLAAAAVFALHTLLCRYSPPATAADPDGVCSETTYSQLQFAHLQAAGGKGSAGGSSLHSSGGRAAGERGQQPSWPGRTSLAFPGLRSGGDIPSPAFGSGGIVGSSTPGPGPSVRLLASPTRVVPDGAATHGTAAGHAAALGPFGSLIGRQSFRTTSALTFNSTSSPPLQEHGQRPSTSVCVPRHSMLVSEQIEAILDLKRVSAPQPSAGAPLDFPGPGQDHTSSQPSAGVSNRLMNAQRRRRRGSNVSMDLPTYYTASRLANLDLRPPAPSASASVSHSEDDGNTPRGPRRLAHGRSVAWRTLVVANAPANAGGAAGGMPSPGSPRSDSSLRRLASLPSRLRTTGAAAAAAAAERAVREVDGLGPSGFGELPCPPAPNLADVTPFQPPCLAQMLRRGLGGAGWRQTASAGGAPPPPAFDDTAAGTSRATAIGLPSCEVFTGGTTSRATVTAGMLTASHLHAHDAAAAAEGGRRASGLSPLGGGGGGPATAALDPDLRKEALRQMVMARWRASMASEATAASGGAAGPSPPRLPGGAAARAVSPAAAALPEAAGHTRPRSSRISFIGELQHSKPHSRTSSRRLLMDTGVSATEANDAEYDDAASMYTADDLGPWPGPEYGLDLHALPRSTAAAAAALAAVAALAEDLTASSQRSASCLGGGGLASGVASGAATALTGNSRRSLAAYSSRNTSMKAGPLSHSTSLDLGQLQQLESGPGARLRAVLAWVQSSSSGAGVLLVGGGHGQQAAVVLLHAAVCTCRDLSVSGWLQLAARPVHAAATRQLILVLTAWVLAAAAPLLLALAHAAAVATGRVPLRLSNTLWVARIAIGQLLQRAALPALGLQAAWGPQTTLWHVGYYAAAAPLTDTQYAGLVLVLSFGFAMVTAIGGLWQQGAAVLGATLGSTGAPAAAAAAASVATSIVASLLVPLLRHAALLLACAMAGAAAGLAVARKAPQAACSALSQWARRRLPVQLGMQVTSLAAYALGDPEAPSLVPFVLLLVAQWPIRTVWSFATSLAAFPFRQQASHMGATPVSALTSPGLVPGIPAAGVPAALPHSPAAMQQAQVAAASAAVLLLLLLLLSGAQTMLLSWLTGDRRRTERYSDLQSQLLVLKTQLMAAPTVLELLGSLTAGCEQMLPGCSAWAVVVPSSSMEGGEEQQLLELQHVSGVLVELRAQADLQPWPSACQGSTRMTAEPAAAAAAPAGAAAPGDWDDGGMQDGPVEMGRVNEEISCRGFSTNFTVGLQGLGQHEEGLGVPGGDAEHSSGEVSISAVAGTEPGQEGGAAVSAAAVIFAPVGQSPQLAVDNETQEGKSPDLDFLKARPGGDTTGVDSPIGLRSRSGLLPPVRSLDPPAPRSPPAEPIDPRRPSDSAQAQRNSIPGQPPGAAPSIPLAEYPSLGLALVHRVVWAVHGHTARAYSSAAALSDSVLATQPTPSDLARLCAGVGAAGLLVVPLECLAQPYGLLVVACPTPADVDRHLRLLCLGLADGLAQALYLKQMQAEVAASEMVMQDIYPSHAVEVLKRRFHAQGGAAAGLAGSGPSCGARNVPIPHAPGTAPPTPLPYTNTGAAADASTMPGETDEPKPDTTSWPVLGLQQSTLRTPSHSLSGAEHVAQALAGAGARSPLKFGQAVALGDSRMTPSNSIGSIGPGITVRTARGRLTSASGGSPFHCATGPLSRLASVDQGTLGALAAGLGPGLGLTLPLVNTVADADAAALAQAWGASNSGGLGSLGVSSSGYVNASSPGVFSPAAAAVASALLRMEAGRATSPSAAAGGGQPGHVASTGSNAGAWDSAHAATGASPLNSDVITGTAHSLGMPNDVPYARWHQHVSVLFADIVGYTSTSQALEPEQVMALLHSLFCKYDALLTKYGVYKVETIGDCFMAATGLVNETPLHALDLVRFGRAMIAAAAEVANPVTGEPLQIRVGINSGRVMSGIVGSCRARYCLFGDTVNSASRMESTGVPGRIQISEETYAALPEEERKAWECRGYVECKGKGLMKTYLHMAGEP